jgi:hypothetical protein
MPAKPCQPNCQCGKHFRSREHNMLIGLGVKRTYKERRHA